MTRPTPLGMTKQEHARHATPRHTPAPGPNWGRAFAWGLAILFLCLVCQGVA